MASISALVVANAAASVPHIITFAPSFANSIATALPKPLLDANINATLFCIPKFIFAIYISVFIFGNYFLK
jgi:hypothetical protein